MKKIVVCLLLISLISGLCACGGGSAAATPEPAQTPVPTPDMTEILAASASDAEQAAQQLPPASSTDATAMDEQMYALAQECIGLTVEELYELIGEPGDVQYQASCEGEEGEEAEDGMLFYDGFYVWTVRTNEHEIVRDVYAN